MQVRRMRVQIETERLRIVGTLQLPTEGYRSRVTDFLNSHETGFIALTDAHVTSIQGNASVAQDFVAVGCRHIAALVELEDLGVAEDEARGEPLGLTGPSIPPPAAVD
jgi:hypothetical protein